MNKLGLNIRIIHQQSTSILTLGNIENLDCAAQFWSKFNFKQVTLIHPEIGLELHYNEAHHKLKLLDGNGETVKSAIFHKVLSGEVFIDSPDEFSHNAGQIFQTDSLYFSAAKILDDYEGVQYSPSILNKSKPY